MNIVTADYKFIQGKPVINLFVREGKKKIVKTITDFRPYFFVTRKKDISSITFMVNNIIYKENNITYEESTKKTIDGRKVWKVCYTNPKATYDLRDKFEETFEADIEFTRRWFIDKIAPKDLAPINYRKLFIDIETTTDKGFPHYENPQEKITCVTIYDNYEDVMMTFVLNNEKEKVITKGRKIVYWIKSEEKLLKELIKFWSYFNPDIIIGWNVGFDISYIFSRCRKLKVDYTKVGYQGEAFAKSDKENEIRIRGSVIFDMLFAYKKFIYHEIPSYSLAYVTKKELGEEEGKEVILDVGKLWKEDKEKTIKYNQYDVEVLKKLDKKLRLIEYWDSIRVAMGVPDIWMARIASKINDTVLLRTFNYLALPTKDYNAEKIRPSGGYVKEPKRGVYDNVAVFDFVSLYPHLIKTFNLSYDTYNEKDYDYTTMEDSKNLKGFWSLKKTGLVPQLLDSLINLRNQFKEKRDTYVLNSEDWRVYDMFQKGIKFPLNAIYGLNLYPGFRLFKPEVGATITYLGRQLNKHCQKRIQEDFEVEVVYCDTDSLFIPLKDNTLAFVREMQEAINQKYVKEFVDKYSEGKIKNTTLEVNLEKIYKKLLLVKKRRYIGEINWKEGKSLEKYERQFVGVDLKRTNTPRIMHNGLIKFIKALFSEEDIIKVIQDYLHYIDKCDDIQLFAQPYKINSEYKTTASLPQFRAAEFANKQFNLNFKEGSKFYGVWVTGLKTNVIGFDIPERVEKYKKNIDRVRYKETFINKIKILYDVDDVIFLRLEEEIKKTRKFEDKINKSKVKRGREVKTSKKIRKKAEGISPITNFI